MDKHHVNEGETAFVTFHVEADPVPEVEWFKVPGKWNGSRSQRRTWVATPGKRENYNNPVPEVEWLKVPEKHMSCNPRKEGKL